MGRDTEAVPTPPWHKTKPATRPRRHLDQDQIVAATLKVLDAEGLDAVSMRRVAAELDTGPASLYAHVANKNELLDLVYDRVLVDIEVPEPDPARWADQFKDVVRACWRATAAHNDIAAAALANIPVGPNSLRIAEGMLAILVRGGGLAPRDASWAIDRIALYIAADAYEGSLHLAKQRASGKSVQEYTDEFVGQLRDYYASLPEDRFPLTVGSVGQMTAGSSDERFEYGLDLLVDGLAARSDP
ncbi:TetR family transcriptional regulator [Herbihabitans rhizosphaerae]|uniref:TetR family transcriptional regulator n=1 Tax=Herbihabitans rhizosphaerae TaxID=1872711 RepID=A0A4Q7L7P1_9PSEU|nr:TetR/AcrR family transcriptional regulator [Herbihabitans rhizosphaerae]RZS44382.1 TetR family transcriptional regulator [Herbihabitans rhizosphaerae]